MFRSFACLWRTTSYYILAMGTFLTKDPINKEIDDQLRLEYSTINTDKTALLIGPKNSGKTTILKQFYYTQTGSNEIDINIFDSQCLENIRKNCIETIISLSKLVGDAGLYALTERLKTENDMQNVCNVIQKLWKTKLYKQTYLLRHLHTTQQIPPNMDYFLDKIDLIMRNNYKITSQDLLMHKTSNKNIYQFHGNIEGFNGIHLFDFGNILPLQILPNHITNKPLQMFENIDGIIYISSLSDYCIYDNEIGINRLEYSFKMFEALIRLKLFKKTRFSLVLSKYDILKQMLKNGISLSEYFGNKWNSKNDYKNRKLPLTIHHLTRTIENGNGNIQIPKDLRQLMIEFLIENNENDKLLNECTNKAAMFIKDKYVEIYNKYTEFHDYPLNIDWYPNVCTNLEVMRATLWGIRCCLYER